MSTGERRDAADQGPACLMSTGVDERAHDAVVRQRLLQVIGKHPAAPVASLTTLTGQFLASDPDESAVPAGHSDQVDPVSDTGTAGTGTAGTGTAGTGTTGAPGPERRLPFRRGSDAFDPGRRGVKALAVVGVLVVLIAGFLAWRSRPQVEPVSPGLPGTATLGASAWATGSTRGAPGPGGTEVVVAVAGKVKRPGLVRLPPGSRVADAIAAAGGVLPGTDTVTVNLARKVSDGELILVGVPVPAGAEAAGPAGGGPGGAAPGSKVNLNTATLAELDVLPGVGPVLAQRIIDHRVSHGSFRSVSDLRQVDGIGDSRFDELKDLVTV